MKLSILLFLFCMSALGKGNSDFRKEFIDFKNIQEVLKNDRLKAHVQNRKLAAVREKKLKGKASKYKIPGEAEFWTFFSEYWIVKNAAALKWDFEKTDYGLDITFRSLLEALGFYEKRFKILLLNTADVSHFSLPSDNHENIFLLSLPFVKTLDLSKLEISVLLLEDFLRARQGHFKKLVKSDQLNAFLGGSFLGKKLDKSILAKVSKKYDQIIFDQGFNFQQQFKVTHQMDSMLKANAKWWNTYYNVIGKIDRLVKSNVQYKKYLRIYPSPELQLSWLKPKEKKFL